MMDPIVTDTIPVRVPSLAYGRWFGNLSDVSAPANGIDELMYCAHLACNMILRLRAVGPALSRS